MWLTTLLALSQQSAGQLEPQQPQGETQLASLAGAAIKIWATKDVKKHQCVNIVSPTNEEEQMHDLAESLLEIEYRWKRGGYFDGLYVSERFHRYIEGYNCVGLADWALTLIMNLRDAIVNDIGVLPGSNPDTPPAKIRYFPSDSLIDRLYGCEPSFLGSTCLNSSASALKPCPPGASTVLIDSAYYKFENDPRFSCVKVMPSAYQRDGYAAIRAWESFKSSREVGWHERDQKALYTGTVYHGHKTQRNFLTQNKTWCQPKYCDTFTQNWLHTPEHMTTAEAVKYRYLIDVGGSSGTTWDALQWKMASGSLVFKVKTPVNAQDFWHREVHHNKHVIEVEHDLSDLHAKWLWATQNQAAAETIALQGQQLALQWASKEVAVRQLANLLRSEFNYPPRDATLDYLPSMAVLGATSLFEKRESLGLE